MNSRKINLDRPHISSEEINANQNFQEVLKNFKMSKPPIWKTPWFWGSIGLASVCTALLLTIQNENPQQEKYEEKITLASTLPNDTECVKPPIQQEDIPFSEYQINTQKDQRIKLLSGTEIFIPKGSIISNNSSNKVEITVREFRDQASVFLAGIKMDYGSKDAFETAGMLEILPASSSSKAEINPNLPIEIKMNLTKNPSGFDFWFLNESNKEWEQHPATFKTEKKDGKVVEKNTESKLRILIKETDVKITSITSKMQKTEKPQETSFKIPTEGHQRFDLSFNKTDYPELASFESLVFEVIPTSGYDKSFTKKTWSEMKLEKKESQYIAQFSNAKTKVELPVRPVLSGKELKKAEQDFDVAISTYNETIQKLAKEIEELDLQRAEYQRQIDAFFTQKEQKAEERFIANVFPISESKEIISRREVNDFQNSAGFQVNQWGRYNCDKPIAYPSPLKNEPYFTWKGNSTMQVNSLYVFDLEKKTRYSFGAGTIRALDKFGFFKKDEVLLVAIDKNGEIGQLFLPKDKTSLSLEQFTFERKEKGVKTIDWLKNLLNENIDS
jgi:hypothetical protein